jgi:hypothetical protein
MYPGSKVLMDDGPATSNPTENVVMMACVLFGGK